MKKQSLEEEVLGFMREVDAGVAIKILSLRRCIALVMCIGSDDFDRWKGVAIARSIQRAFARQVTGLHPAPTECGV